MHIADKLPPLPERANPLAAAAAGFFLGAAGLGLYFRSWTDFFIPAGVLVVCFVLAPFTAGISVGFAAMFCAIWGYKRAKASNDKLRAQLSVANPTAIAPDTKGNL